MVESQDAKAPALKSWIPYDENIPLPQQILFENSTIELGLELLYGHIKLADFGISR
jgi:serum/glucocorticoid-regulated kinase 2